jgi:hypothetical protein
MAHVHYIEVNPSTHKILRHGICAPGCIPTDPEEAGNEIVAVEANPFTDKYVGGQVVPKTEDEIIAELPAAIGTDDQLVNVTQSQWQDVLARLQYLEAYSPAVPVRVSDGFGLAEDLQVPVVSAEVTESIGMDNSTMAEASEE